MIASVAGAFVVACSGCGGGDDGGTTKTSSAERPARTVLIESYGDSTTQGWQEINGIGNVTRHTAPAELQKMLQAQFGASVTVDNRGVGSTQASQLLNGTDGVHPTWANQMAASKASIVTLNFGLNDAYYSVVKKDGIQSETPEDFATIVSELVRVAREHGKQVVIFEPNPTCEPIREPLMPAYVSALRQAAAEAKVPIVAEYDLIQSIPNWQALLTDCLHPSDALYRIKAEKEFEVIQRMVTAMLSASPAH